MRRSLTPAWQPKTHPCFGRGDTLSTQQATRAMLSHCVPVFVVHEPRELPFFSLLDYTQFSLTLSVFDFQRPRGEFALIARLRRLVQNGAYDAMCANLRAAAGFFDYTRHVPHSPYGALLAEIASLDEMGVPVDVHVDADPDESFSDVLAQRAKLRAKLHEAWAEGESEIFYEPPPPSHPPPSPWMRRRRLPDASPRTQVRSANLSAG